MINKPKEPGTKTNFRENPQITTQLITTGAGF